MNRIRINIVRTLVCTAVFFTSSFSQQYLIKFASISPEGTTWMNVMHEYDNTIRKESGGRIGFKMYPGAVQGDEKTVVRKIAVGQLHAAGFTGVGLGGIVPKIRLLDAPFLIQTDDEAENLYKKFDGEIRTAFEANGYELIGLVEIGFVYSLQQNPYRRTLRSQAAEDVGVGRRSRCGDGVCVHRPDPYSALHR